jgi:hypothetical protein
MTRTPGPADVAALIDGMFADVLSAAERRELRVWIERWDAENPDVDPANRVTGWIDVAYAFQARQDAGLLDDTEEVPDTEAAGNGEPTTASGAETAAEPDGLPAGLQPA